MIAEEKLQELISDDYWYLMDELWLEYMREYGYTPLMLLFRDPNFIKMWLDYVRRN